MGCFFSKETVQRLGLHIQELDQMVQAWNMDGMPNKSGMVRYKTNIVLDYWGVREHCNLFIINCGKDEVILGLPWLWAINPEIDWKYGRVTLTLSNYRWTTGEPPEVLDQWYSNSKNPFYTNPKYDAWSTTPHSMGILLSLGGDINSTCSPLPTWSLGHVMWPTEYRIMVNLKQQYHGKDFFTFELRMVFGYY